MSMRVRVGPVSLSSRGRVGVSAGPFSVSGGGSRRRSRGSSGDGALVALVGLVLLVGLAVVYWYITLPIAAIGVVLFVWLSRREREARAQYAIEREARLAEEARQREAARIAWLAAPAPPLAVPTRFTEAWFAAEIPNLHPGQIEPLRRALRARGWKDTKIDERIAPYLSANPHLATPAAG